ncbi:MAG: myo-inositol-1(or 4)-monophosphatase [bacterium]|nr:MAG: myo-inositol-1(or 4)-monophosphatase [bacterium]
MHPPNQHHAWLPAVERIAREAGALLMTGFGRGIAIELKGAIDLVTDMDRRSEELVVGRLTGEFPGTTVLAEEGSRGDDAGSGLWIVDPLDGTTNYAHGFPVFAVSIGLERAGVMELGVVFDPTRWECFAAGRGRGATLNGEPIGVSSRDDIGASLLATGFPYDIRTSPQNNLAEFNRFALRARAIRRAGAAALDLCYVAAGRFDGYWEQKLAPWDVAAGSLIVTEAGGMVSGYSGEPPVVRSGRLVASNGRIHAAMLACLAESPSDQGPTGR